MNTSVMLENYCADIERLVREGALHAAVRLSVALPDICAALNDPQMRSSRERYIEWCKMWLDLPISGGRKVLDGARVYHLYSGPARAHRVSVPSNDYTSSALRRVLMSRRARRERGLPRPRVWQPANRMQAFQVDLVEALIHAVRRWYGEYAAQSTLVQRNLGRLLVSG